MHTAPLGRAQLSKWREAFARAYYTHWAAFTYVKEAACAKSHPSCGWTLAFMQRMENKQQEESAHVQGAEPNKAITRANSLKTLWLKHMMTYYYYHYVLTLRHIYHTKTDTDDGTDHQIRVVVRFPFCCLLSHSPYKTLLDMKTRFQFDSARNEQWGQAAAKPSYLYRGHKNRTGCFWNSLYTTTSKLTNINNLRT